MFTPPLEGSRPPSGKSWIRHWLGFKICMKINGTESDKTGFMSKAVANPTDQTFLNFVQFSGKSGKFVCWHPAEGWYPLLRAILNSPLHSTLPWICHLYYCANHRYYSCTGPLNIPKTGGGSTERGSNQCCQCLPVTVVLWQWSFWNSGHIELRRFVPHQKGVSNKEAAKCKVYLYHLHA